MSGEVRRKGRLHEEITLAMSFSEKLEILVQLPAAGAVLVEL